MFTYIIKGFESKNAKTRIECLDQCALLIKRNGVAVCSNASRVFPLIANQISDRDSGVRNSALSVIIQAYIMIGDQVFKLMGRINDKDKSLLEEKIKRLPTAPEEKAVVEKELPVKEASEPALAEEPVSVDKREEIKVPLDSPTKGIKKQFSLDLETLDFPKTSKNLRSSPTIDVPATHNDTAVLDFVINQVTDADPDMSINALKHLEKLVCVSPDSLEPYMNDIVVAVTLQIRIAFTTADIGNVSISRLCKHLVNMLVLRFSSNTLPKLLNKDTLHQCIQELLNRLLDPTLATIENGSQLTKALNVLMVRILENSNRTSSFR